MSADERKRAICLNNALSYAEKLFNNGERSVAVLKSEMEKIVRSTPHIIIDYLEVVNALNLNPIDKIDRKILLTGAIFVGKTRLIDNILIEP